MKPLKLTNLETADLCRQIALLMHSGVSAGDGLNLLADGEENEQLHHMLAKMTASVDSGCSLAQAFEETNCFADYITGLLQVGEQVGRTEETLNALADYYEEKERMERQLVSSLTYPTILLLMMVVVIVILLSQVLPVFNDIYASLGGKLTGMAGGLLLLGQWLDEAIPAICAVLVAVLCAMLIVLLHKGLRKKVISFCAARWGDCGIFRKINNARFAQALSMGFASGMPMEDAAELAAVLVKDIPSVVARCKLCSKMLQQGENLSTALAAGDLMSPSACKLLTLGLRSGTGDAVMEELARRMQEEALQDLEKKVGRVEPAMVLLTSVMVGLILLSVMLPLMNVMTAIG